VSAGRVVKAALFDLGSVGVSMKVYQQGQCAFDTFIARTATFGPAAH
jgi:hypothetical protein